MTRNGQGSRPAAKSKFLLVFASREWLVGLLQPERIVSSHYFGNTKHQDATAPELTGYGSREWIMAIVSDPKHERFYGRRNDRMPSFGRDQVLDEASIGLLADWLRGDVSGGSLSARA